MSHLLAVLVAVACLSATAQTNRPVVAVAQMVTAAQNVSCDGWDRAVYDCNSDLSGGFRAVLETAIFKTRKMEVMERGRLGLVLQEQGRVRVSVTDVRGGIGDLAGVDYLVYGTITRFGSQASELSVSTARGLGSLLGRVARQATGGGLGSRKVAVSMGVDLKVTDVATGRLVLADEVSGTVETGAAFSVGGIAQSEVSADPFADVQRVVAARIEPGEIFTDPDTGEVLGADETPVGTVEITSSDARLSRAAIVAGDAASFEPGTTLKRVVALAEEGSK